MKTFQKFFKTILSLVIVFSTIIPVHAEGTEPPKTAYTITITNSDAISSANHVYKAYQIFKGDLDKAGTTLSNIQWGDNVDGTKFLAALKSAVELCTNPEELNTNIFKDATDAAEVAAILAKNKTSDVVSGFAKVATAKIQNAPIAASEQSDAPYTISIPLDQAGYYLVTDELKDGLTGDAALNKDISDFILQVVADTTVEHKGSIPTMDKQVSETDSTYHDSIATGINDTHYYRITAELPDDYGLYDTYYLEFSDTMSKEITFENIVAVKALIRSSGKEIVYNICNNTECNEENGKLCVGYHVNNTSKNALSVVFRNLKNAGGKGIIDGVEKDIAPVVLTSADAVEIIYKAHLNEQAVVNGEGIPNNAHIKYSNNPNTDGRGQSTPDETNVYPMGLKVIKVDGTDTEKELQGAEFILGRIISDGASSHPDYAVVNEGKIDKWVHHYEGDKCGESHEGETLATPLITGADGSINVAGLDTGDYVLKEIKAPDGYNKLTEDVVFSFSMTIDEANDKIATVTGHTNQGSINFEKVGEKLTGVVELTINNYKGDVLPTTGGIGTTLFYVMGGMMAVAAFVLLVTKRRMNMEA